MIKIEQSDPSHPACWREHTQILLPSPEMWFPINMHHMYAMNTIPGVKISVQAYVAQEMLPHQQCHCRWHGKRPSAAAAGPRPGRQGGPPQDARWLPCWLPAQPLPPMHGRLRPQHPLLVKGATSDTQTLVHKYMVGYEDGSAAMTLEI